MKKKIRFFSAIILIVMLFSFAFSGCDISDVFESSMEDLMQPPMPDEEKYSVKLLLESIAKGNITYVTPKAGYFTTAFVEYDIDGDRNDEMIVFYQEKLNGVTELYIHLFSKLGNEWVSSHRMSTNGTDVHSVDFYDLDGDDGCDEILVLWDNADTQQSLRTLTIYERVNGVISLGDIKPCEKIAVVDLQPDGVMDLVAFNVSRTTTTSVAQADICQYKDSKISVSNTIQLDPGVEGFVSAAASDEKCVYYPQFSPTEEPKLKTRYFPRVLVDCKYQGENQLITYVIYVEKEIEGEFDNPVFLEPKKSELELDFSTRVSQITSTDINNDDVVDMPTLVEFANTVRGDPTGLPFKATQEYMIAWHTYAWYSPEYDRRWVRTEYTVVNSEFNYTVKIPEEWVSDIAFVDNSDKDEYIFYKWDSEKKVDKGEYARVRVFKASYWEENELKLTKISNYTKVATNRAETLVYAISPGVHGMPEEFSLIIN